MPIYTYRCDQCGEVTEQLASINDIPENVVCEHCGDKHTHRIISSVAYHASEAAKTSRLDPKYEKMVDHAMKKSASADENRIIRNLKPFSKAKDSKSAGKK
jgi:putative FmdB family regulatory protein